ncbi:MAG: hypothetical protein RQ728_02310 [Brevefilum sp.]|nr:hypothetical protein [Brevefilum sp.]MDT8381074.1 hypothetical protein [Brevefilum sp.]
MASSIDLATLFGSVTKQLAQNKESLNEADSYNHNHGDNMVQIFNLVQNAVAKRSGKPMEDQLAYASQVVKEKTNSGSANLYAQGLEKAAKNLSGQELNEKSMGVLLQSLLGVDQPEPKPPAKSDNILGSLLSGLAGQSSEPAPSNQSSQTDNVLGALLSGLTGQTSEQSDSDQSLGLDDLMQAGMAYFQSKQSGNSNMEAIISALMAASPMGKSSHRAQSASIVASTIMKFMGSKNK